ncbi:MAG: adenylate/guanylate cyclase domain-containing protein [Bacteroidetes bacterium]|nr:adenylate/guanylate cyclase domain-containing protein [Bacteroidota bacterium]
MITLTAVTRYKLRKLLKYGLVTVAVGGVLMLFNGQGQGAYLGAWLLLGIWTGVLEEFLFGRRFRSLAVPLQFIGKALAVNVLTIALIFFAFAINSEQQLPGGGAGTTHAGQLMAMRPFYRLAGQVVVVTSIAILVVQAEELMGRRLFLGFLLGRYEKPYAEERIVLDIDLVGSTALNEKLGDLRYFRFLNLTHSLMTDAVLRNEAEIHKYVGDEVLFSWTMREGRRDLNCLDLYFDIMERIQAHENDLLREFGAVPRFRGAVHGGRVITAQVGHIKRAIDFSGDVMNTTNRILGLCKDLKADLLVSEDLLKRMPDAEERFILGPELVLPVKGRRREVRVRAVQRARKV